MNLIVNDRDLLSSPFSARRNGPSTSPRKRKKRRRPLLRRPPPPREERSRNERVRIHLLKDQQSWSEESILWPGLPPSFNANLSKYRVMEVVSLLAIECKVFSGVKIKTWKKVNTHSVSLLAIVEPTYRILTTLRELYYLVKIWSMRYKVANVPQIDQ